MKPTIAQRESIPETLKHWNQWVCWRYARPSDGSMHRWCKLPISPVTGRNAKTTSPDTWSDFDTTMTCFKRNKSKLAGVGFVFSANDPFIGIDMDQCRDDKSDELTPWAQSLVEDLDSYTEVSPSGTGVKCIVQSSKQFSSRRRSSPGIEIYSVDRFFTITGHCVGKQRNINERTKRLSESYTRLFPPNQCEGQPPESLLRMVNPISDEAILNRAMKAKNGWKFKKLWNGDLRLYSENASEADMALCRILAFWTGPAPDQIDRIFRQSRLYRPKWIETHYANGRTYGQQTIQRAIIAQDGTFFRWPTGKRREMTTANN